MKIIARKGKKIASTTAALRKRAKVGDSVLPEGLVALPARRRGRIRSRREREAAEDGRGRNCRHAREMAAICSSRPLNHRSFVSRNSFLAARIHARPHPSGSFLSGATVPHLSPSRPASSLQGQHLSNRLSRFLRLFVRPTRRRVSLSIPLSIVRRVVSGCIVCGRCLGSWCVECLSSKFSICFVIAGSATSTEMK